MGFLNLALPLLLMLTVCSEVQAGRIYGGRVALPHSRPYMALLEKINDEDNKIGFCDGFLVREDFVMTAAHCNARSLIVRLGVHDVFKGSQQVMFAEKVYPHPDYDEEYMDYDIMLVKLSEKAVFTDYVKPIPLPYLKNEETPEVCLVSGWGCFNKNAEHGSHLLREVNVTVDRNETCNAYHVICTSEENGPGLGDSGGPLVCGDLAFGVVSHIEDGITAYTRIPDFHFWIQATMSNKTRDKQNNYKHV